MAKTAGRWSSIYFAGYDLSGKLNQFDFNLEFGELDGTGFGEGADNSYPGMPKGTASATSLMDPAANQSHAALKTPGGYTDKMLMILIGGNAAPVIGDTALCMQCKQFTYKPTIAVKAAVVANATFASAGIQVDINGKVQANTTITNTTNFASVNNGASSANGGAAYLEVLTPPAADTYATKVQHSPNDSTWADLATFTANGSARTSERQEFSGTVDQYTRAVATRTGAAGNDFKLAVALARH